jgi:hypothetical protein
VGRLSDEFEALMETLRGCIKTSIRRLHCEQCAVSSATLLQFLFSQARKSPARAA